MRYFKIIAQDGHVFWLSDSIIPDKALFVERTEDGSVDIFLQHSDELLTFLAEYPSEKCANAVLAELKEAYWSWNSGYSDNPVETLKWFTAKNYYELPNCRRRIAMWEKTALITVLPANSRTRLE